ncbi:SGNH/GDSL hydrolase family protein [Dongia rigui]|uniref:SGNH/GDSL hydrolase family protein n=1 Tax=Dongia rigui TaxID=940149 RepID=A0ABU5E0Z4_9PROT|nr:hypothetical protein [Dongia rigui]MDY0873133.1 hypothetical protein [Dongia rigui]
MPRLLRYAILFALPVAIAASALGLSYLVLDRAGETIDPLAAARLQQGADVVYSSALFYRPRPYKIERARLTKADIVLLGSSRAMQFVGAPWKVPTYNAGGAMRDLESGEIFTDSLLELHHPKRIIISLDWWWFSQSRRPDAPSDASPDTPLTLHELVQPAVWLWDGTLTRQRLQALLLEPGALKPAIGLPAQFMHAGWDPFGHYDYGDILTEQAGGNDIGFQETLKDIQRHSKRNDRAPSNAFSEESWQRLEALVKRFQDSGAEVILILPPVAGPVYDWIAAQPEPNLVKEVQRRLPTLPALTFDFHDPKTLGTDTCEFVDGIHGGEVTYLRVLDAIAADPSADLESAVDRPLIQRLIADNAGHASLKHDDPDRMPEADFNSLGCRK